MCREENIHGIKGHFHCHSQMQEFGSHGWEIWEPPILLFLGGAQGRGGPHTHRFSQMYLTTLQAAEHICFSVTKSVLQSGVGVLLTQVRRNCGLPDDLTMNEGLMRG
jgi:hypothetical protein